MHASSRRSGRPHEGPPPNQRALAARLRNLADDLGIAEPRLRRTVAHTIAGQMLPAGVVKGGASIRLRADRLDPAEVADAGARLFAYRRQQAGPPTVVVHGTWPDLDAAATSELASGVLPLGDAVAWLNELNPRAGQPSTG